MRNWLRSIAFLLGLVAWQPQAIAVDTAGSVAKTADEQAQRTAVFEQVHTAINADDFAALSAMEDEFRSGHAKTSSGAWKLELYHAGLQFYLADGLKAETGCEYRDEKFVRQWATAMPRSPAPSITDAALLLKQAWCFRGPGYADAVLADSWPKFQQGIAAALKTLNKGRAVASHDPEFYAVKLDALHAQGMDGVTFQKAVDDATIRAPDYHRIYYNAVWHFLPQWGGSFEAVDAFARYATERSHASEQDALYARIYWSLESCSCHIIEKHADWPTMKQSMRSIFDQYPTRWNGEAAANISCRMGDTEEGRRYIRAVHPEATDERSFAALFAACDLRAQHRS